MHLTLSKEQEIVQSFLKGSTSAAYTAAGEDDKTHVISEVSA